MSWYPCPIYKKFLGICRSVQQLDHMPHWHFLAIFALVATWVSGKRPWEGKANFDEQRNLVVDEAKALGPYLSFDLIKQPDKTNIPKDYCANIYPPK